MRNDEVTAPIAIKAEPIAFCACLLYSSLLLAAMDRRDSTGIFNFGASKASFLLYLINRSSESLLSKPLSVQNFILDIIKG